MRDKLRILRNKSEVWEIKNSELQEKRRMDWEVLNNDANTIKLTMGTLENHVEEGLRWQ